MSFKCRKFCNTIYAHCILITIVVLYVIRKAIRRSVLMLPKQILNIERPTDVPDTGLLCDVLWSDPKQQMEQWEENERGVSFTFNQEVVE